MQEFEGLTFSDEELNTVHVWDDVGTHTAFDTQTLFHLNKDALAVEGERIISDFGNWKRLSIEVESKKKELKSQLDGMAAVLAMKGRNGGVSGKVTETAISEYVAADPAYLKMQSNYNDFSRKSSVIQGVVDTLEKKFSMIKALIKLKCAEEGVKS